jgi:hypothetical protein
MRGRLGADAPLSLLTTRCESVGTIGVRSVRCCQGGTLGPEARPAIQPETGSATTTSGHRAPDLRSDEARAFLGQPATSPEPALARDGRAVISADHLLDHAGVLLGSSTPQGAAGISASSWQGCINRSDRFARLRSGVKRTPAEGGVADRSRMPECGSRLRAITTTQGTAIPVAALPESGMVPDPRWPLPIAPLTKAGKNGIAPRRPVPRNGIRKDSEYALIAEFARTGRHVVAPEHCLGCQDSGPAVR